MTLCGNWRIIQRGMTARYEALRKLRATGKKTKGIA